MWVAEATSRENTKNAFACHLCDFFTTYLINNNYFLSINVSISKEVQEITIKCKLLKLLEMKEKIRNNHLAGFKNIRRPHQDWSSCHTDQTHQPAKRTPLNIANFSLSKCSGALSKSINLFFLKSAF